MGKRIKWLNEAECAEIRNGAVDYITYMSQTHVQQNDRDKALSREQLHSKFRNIDFNR